MFYQSCLFVDDQNQQVFVFVEVINHYLCKETSRRGVVLQLALEQGVYYTVNFFYVLIIMRKSHLLTVFSGNNYKLLLKTF